jgi:hypothetical protein
MPDVAILCPHYVRKIAPARWRKRAMSKSASFLGERNFQGGDKEAETALEIQGRRRARKAG